MWWIGLPGMTGPSADEDLADRAIALACAARFKPVNPADGGNASTQTEVEAAAFADWLALADDPAGRRTRRLALCMACEQPTGQRGDILQTAESLRKNLTETR